MKISMVKIKLERLSNDYLSKILNKLQATDGLQQSAIGSDRLHLTKTLPSLTQSLSSYTMEL